MKRTMYILIVLLTVFFNIAGCNAKSITDESKTIILYVGSSIMTVNDIEIKIDSAPIIRNNRVFVPIRDVFEQMGIRVEWNNDNHTIIAYNGLNTIHMIINSETAYISNKEYALDSPPVIINSKTYIPLRFISEGLGFTVDWNENQKKITINNRSIENKDINANTEVTSDIDSIKSSELKEESDNMININIKIGNSDFSAKLYNNKTVKELVKSFPATYNMSDLHENEKYYYLPNSIPTDIEIPDYINKGEIMLFGSDCLVVFYDTFPNSYSYTRLGYIDNTSGLKDAVGKGNVDIRFELQ